MQYSFHPAGLEQSAVEKMGPILHDRLRGLLDLAMTLKHIHWNVIGPGFIAVHEMLDEHEADVRLMADAVAERIATFGGIPNGLPGHLARERSWDDYSIGRAVVAAHLGALDKVYDGVIEDHRTAIGETEKNDPVTADLLTGQTGKLELYQWFVRAHLANTSGELPTSEVETEVGAAAAAAVADPME